MPIGLHQSNIDEISANKLTGMNKNIENVMVQFVFIDECLTPIRRLHHLRDIPYDPELQYVIYMWLIQHDNRLKRMYGIA